GSRRERLRAIRLARKQPVHPLVQKLQVDFLGVKATALIEVGGEIGLLAPVAVQIQVTALEAKGAIGGAIRTGCDERTPAECRQPRVWRGPRQLREFDGLLGFNGDLVADGGEVHEDMAKARPADRKRCS